MSARVYFKKRVKDCKDVFIMSPQDEQWWRTSLLSVCILHFSCFISTTVCSQNINKQNVNIADETLSDYSFLSITILNQRIIYKDDIRHWIPRFIGTPM